MPLHSSGNRWDECSLCSGDFYCNRNENLPTFSFQDPLRNNVSDPIKNRVVTKMQVRAFGSMGAEGINDKNYANVFMNTPINMNGAGAIGKMMGRGNKYNWRCGDCFESSVYEISSDAEAEEKGYLYADPDNLDSTGFNNITIFPNVDTSWCVHKVQVDICARPGPQRLKVLILSEEVCEWTQRAKRPCVSEAQILVQISTMSSTASTRLGDAATG